MYFYHPDHLGSSSLITDASGNVTQHIEYVPYGEVFIEEKNSTWSTPYKFNAKELDEETGLYYYGARYYDPKTSVWISSDPLREKYANISSYVYCVDNPLKFIDPDGKDIVLSFYNYVSKKYSEYIRIKSNIYKDVNFNIDIPRPLNILTLSETKPIVIADKGKSGMFICDEVATIHGKPDAVALALGVNIAGGKNGAGGNAEIGLILNGQDKGTGALYTTENSVKGLEASVGIQLNFIKATDLNDFDKRTLEGYSEGFQGGASAVGGSIFRSYSLDKNNNKDKLLYTGYSYGVGLGPEDLSVSGSYFEGFTKYRGEVTNLNKTRSNTPNTNTQSTQNNE